MPASLVAKALSPHLSCNSFPLRPHPQLPEVSRPDGKRLIDASTRRRILDYQRARSRRFSTGCLQGGMQ